MDPPTTLGAPPDLLEYTLPAAEALKKCSEKQLARLMHISPTLAESTYNRAQQWNTSFDEKEMVGAEGYNYKQALFAYTGEVYRAFKDKQFTDAEYTYMQKHLRILSGLYGITKPLAFIKPYRLEMGTRIAITEGSITSQDLYTYWGDILQGYIEKEFHNDEPIINLASVEYSKALKHRHFKERVYTIDFKVNKDGVFKNIGVIAKKQRGEMTYWMVKNALAAVADIKNYRNNGFKYNSKQSSPQHFVFTKG